MFQLRALLNTGVLIPILSTYIFQTWEFCKLRSMVCQFLFRVWEFCKSRSTVCQFLSRVQLLPISFWSHRIKRARSVKSVLLQSQYWFVPTKNKTQVSKTIGTSTKVIVVVQLYLNFYTNTFGGKTCQMFLLI